MNIRYDPKPGESDRQIAEIAKPDGRGEIILDFDREGRLIGIEVLAAKTLLRPAALSEATLLEPPATDHES
ncbi:DUF2283 domain-containing protein [Microbacterium sp. WCS2018Hpa-9]|uniref:DUF2283 domain-containing protein n=1 Tax=Microbacterium sp. WCS2018Hpa-9 TaxID=3073635 RepID=UPI0037C511A4